MHKAINILGLTLTYLTVASPFVIILGFIVGIKAWKSHQASGLETAILGFSFLMLLTIVGVFVWNWNNINQPGYDGSELSGLAPAFLLPLFVGPQSIITTALLIIIFNRSSSKTKR